MFFQLSELLRWLGLTIFEIWIALVCFTAFTILLTLKVEVWDYGNTGIFGISDYIIAPPKDHDT